MALDIASIGERARQAVPLERLMQNVGILVRSSGAVQTDDQSASNGNSEARTKHYNADENIPLRARMNAWWHGNIINQDAAPHTSADVETVSPIDMTRWTEQRIEVVEFLWGNGFLEPGGAAGVRKLFLHVMPNSKQSVLDLTTGLGGTAFTLAHDQNLWMDALEWDEVLSAEANRSANTGGLGDQVPVGKLSLDAIDIAQKKYNLIYSRERLFTVAEKIELLTAAAEGLRTGGNLVITDLVLTGTDRLDTDGFRNWVQSEPITPHPWTMALYVKTLKELGLAVVTRQDSTEQYLSEIRFGWQKAVKLLEKGEFNLKLGDQLLAEGKVWSGRTAALEGGDLALCRLIARRP